MQHCKQLGNFYIQNCSTWENAISENYISRWVFTSLIEFGMEMEATETAS
jgi:hypothetical protein